MFITPATSNGDPPGETAREQLRQGSLVEERVAAGHQEDVHVGLGGKPGEHRRLVHVRPDRTHDTLGTEPFEGRVGVIQGGLPMAVRVVDVQDVNALQPETLEARLDRAADAVRGVVEHHLPAAHPRVERVVLITEGLWVDVVPGPDSARRANQPADLGRQHELVPGPAREGAAHRPLGRAVAIQRGNVEVADPDRPGVLHRRRRVRRRHGLEQAADRRPAKGQPGDLQTSTPERDQLDRIEGHPNLRGVRNP